MTLMQENENNFFKLSESDMKKYGYEVVDMIVKHFINLKDKKVVSVSSRKEMDDRLMEEIPEHGSSLSDLLAAVEENIFKRQSFTTHPKFYSFVPSPNNFVSVMADALVSGFNPFSGSWKTSSGAAEAEIVTINWLLKLFGFGTKEGGGLFVSGGSAANLTGLACARVIKCGDDFSKARVYFSDQTHSSVLKNLDILGFKESQIRIIHSDETFRLNIDKLRKSIIEDRSNGYQPMCVVANAGTTNCGVVDDLEEIADLAIQENLWMHVDAAYGGAAILDARGKKQLEGIERADSITVDPHKWFFQPYEIGCILVKNGENLKKAFSVDPEYLRDVLSKGGEIDMYNYGIELTRRFRAFKFYMSIKAYGISTFKAAISYGIDLAENAQRYIESKENWEIMSEASLAIINFRYSPKKHTVSESQINEVNHFISDKIFESREAMLATTILREQTVLRMCLINPDTTMDDIKDTLSLCENFASEFIDKHS